MAISRPQAIDDAPRRGLTAKKVFLVSRGMAETRGLPRGLWRG